MSNSTVWKQLLLINSTVTNASAPKYDCVIKNFEFILWLIVTNAAMAFLTTSLNFLIILTFTKTASLRENASNVLILGLAISDFSVGIIAEPLFCVFKFLQFKLGKTAKISQQIGHFLFNISYQLSSVSFLTLTAITVDRFLAVHLHLRYQELVTTKRYGITLACIWIVDSMIFLQYIFDIPVQVFNFVISPLLCGLLVINMYLIFKISRVIHRHSVQIQAQQQSVQQSLDMPRYKKSVNTMYFVIAAFVLCYFPHLVTMILEIIRDSKPQFCLSTFLYFFHPIGQTLVMLNSLINPVIYYWRIKEMRNAVQRFIQGIWQRQEVNQ